MDYDLMPAGDKIDCAIAELVMGWKVDGPDKTGCLKATLPDRRVRYLVPHDIELGDLEDIAFKPSTNIAHAFEVARTITARGWGFGLTGYPTGLGAEFGASFKCAFFAKHATTITAEGPAPLAICRAALKTLALKAD